MRGPARLWRGGTEIALRPRERAVLAALAFLHPRPATPDDIVELLWEYRPPPTARKSIHNHVARVRRAADGVIVTSAAGYELAPHVTLVPWEDGDGEPYADLADTPEVEVGRARALAAAETAEDAALEAAVRADAPDTLARLREATERRRLDERRWWLLGLHLARRGRRRDALLALHDARSRLAEAGLVPGEPLLALEGLIVGDDPRLTTPAGLTEILDAALGRPPHPSAAATREIPTIHPHHDDPFVGRRRELAALDAAWREALHTGPVLALITAPAGMGKTRLADRFVRALHTDDPSVRVVLGRGRATGERAFDTLVESFGVDLPPADPDDATVTRSRFARAVRERLAELLDGPTVWCVDDLQWVGPDALGVIDAALDGLRGPLLVLATVRTGEHAASEPLAALQRNLFAHHVPLAPLTVDEIEGLLAADPAHPAERHLADIVHARTGGLPLYASELARAARREHAPVDPDRVPAALRDWITARRQSLPATTAGVLDVAAVLGERCDTDLLVAAATALGGSGDAVRNDCDALVTLGLLQPGAPGELAFAHAITRELVYDQIGPTTRARLHRVVADAIAGNEHPDQAALAHHYARAGASSRRDAARAARLAGDEAYRVGSWDRAARHYRQAAELGDQLGDEEARAEVLVEIGRAELRADRHAAAADALTEAGELARVRGLALVEAHATLALVGRAGRGAAVAAGDAEHARLLRRAIAALQTYRPGNAAVAREREITMSALERELAFVLLFGDADERNRLLDASLARARALDPPDPAALAAALLGARYAKLDAGALTSRLADVDEVLRAPRREVGYANVLAAMCYRVEDLFRLGRLDAVAEALADAELVVREHPDPYWRWALRAWQAVHTIECGDLDEAEALAHHAAALRPDVPEAAACLVANLVDLALYRGGGAEFAGALDAAISAAPHVPAYRAVLALCLARSGDAAERARARSELTALTAGCCAALPHDTNRFFAIALLAHAAAELGDRAAAAVTRHQLAPFSGQWVAVMVYGGGGAVWGPVDHALARLARLLGDDAEADELFERAERQAAQAPHALARIRRDRLAA